MTQRTFYMRLPESGSSVEWKAQSSSGETTSGRMALEEVSGQIGGATLVVVVPVTAVTASRVSLPPLRRSQQRQAALYALEDQLIDDVEELHAALGERNANGELPVIVVSRARIAGWLEQLALYHLRPQQLLVDALLLPYHAGEWSLLWEDDGIRLRIGQHEVFGFEHGGWQELWPRLITAAGEERPTRVKLFDGRTEPQQELPVAELLPNVEVIYLPRMAGMRWLAQAGRDTPINLLQERFSRREQWGQYLRPWRAAAALLLLWMVLQSTLSFIEMRTLHNEENQLDEQMEAIYRATFPDARKVVDPRLQMEQRLAALKGNSGGFIKLVASAAPALKKANAQLKQIRYQEGRLDIELSLADMASLDSLRAELVANTLHVEISNTTNQDGRLYGHLILHGGGA